METKNIYQEVVFAATPQRVYDCYMDEDEHADITGGEAEIEARVGGKFSAYDGYAVGGFIALEPAKLIKQTWRAEEDNWPDDHFSVITIDLEEHAEGCLMKFAQIAVPANHYDAIAQGWEDYYWQPMKEHLENRPLA